MKNEEITIQCCGLIAITGGRRYAWGLGDRLEIARRGLVVDDVLSGAIIGENSMRRAPEGTGWWILFVADCAFPPMYLVQADSFSEALEIFENSEEGEKLMKIDDEDLGDYDDGAYTCNDNGVPLDSEGLQAWAVESLVFYAGSPPKEHNHECE